MRGKGWLDKLIAEVFVEQPLALPRSPNKVDHDVWCMYQADGQSGGVSRGNVDHARGYLVHRWSDLTVVSGSNWTNLVSNKLYNFCL